MTNIPCSGILLLIVCGLAVHTPSAAPQASAAVNRRPFDFVVGVDGDFKKALDAASKSASSENRYYIFFPDGEYNIGTLTGNSNQMTTMSTPNVSFIGQSADKTVIFNKSVQEGISITATLYFNKAHNLYLQDLTILNKANYGDPSTYNTTGRHVAIMEQGNDLIYKNVKLLSTQDTYYTKGNRTYWENGELHGTTDFICGGGDIFFNKCLIYIDKVSCITAPATATSWGYVFSECTIDGSVGSYRLGRSWNNTPKCVFINTIMKKVPVAEGWGDPMNVVPSLFAEYNSRTTSGSAIDLGSRRKNYTSGSTTVTLNPVLTAEQAAKYTIENVLTGTDKWQPAQLTKQVNAPVVALDGTNLKWDDNDNALCWVVFRNNKFFKCVVSNSCEVTPDLKTGYTVRAANAMGGLGPVSNTVGDAVATLLPVTGKPAMRALTSYNHHQKQLHIGTPAAQTLRVNIITLVGRTVFSKEFRSSAGCSVVTIPLGGLGKGMYLVRTVSDETVDVGYLRVL